MRTTGKFDKNGLEVFEGDKVIKAWGWFTYKGETKNSFRIHTITVKPAHKMANGEMHDDGGGIIFCLGTAYNYWEGKEVTKLTSEEVNEMRIEEDTDFFFDENNKAVLRTAQLFLGLSDEEYAKLAKGYANIEHKLMWGK